MEPSTTEMISEIYNKIVLKQHNNKSESKPRKVSLRQYFIKCYAKESIYRDMTPFELTQGSLDEVANLAAQITFKLLTSEQKQFVETQYERLSEQELEHIKSL